MWVVMIWINLEKKRLAKILKAIWLKVAPDVEVMLNSSIKIRRFTMDHQLKAEEDNFTLAEITKLTKEGIMQWNCEEFYPVSLVGDDDSPCLFQYCSCTSILGGFHYEVEIQESISIPQGIPSVYFVFTRDENEFSRTISFSSEVETEQADLFPMEHDNYLTRLYLGIRFVQVIFPVILQQSVVKESYHYTIYCVGDYSNAVLDHPLTKLGKKLLDQEGASDFHQMVIDEYCQTFLTTMNQS